MYKGHSKHLLHNLFSLARCIWAIYFKPALICLSEPKMHEQLKERLWCVKGRKVTVDCVMILMTAIIGRLFNKHHRFVYCLTWKLWGAYSASGVYLPPSFTNYSRGVLDLSKCAIQCWLPPFLKHFYQNGEHLLSQPTLMEPSLKTLKQSFHTVPKFIFFKKVKGQGILVIHRLLSARVPVSSVLHFHRQPLMRLPTLLPPSRACTASCETGV